MEVSIDILSSLIEILFAGREGRPGQSEVHISYHNGDHYNSVRRMGDCGASPSRIRLCLVTDCDNYRQHFTPPDLSPDSGQESDYENSPSSTKLDRLGRVFSLGSHYHC